MGSAPGVIALRVWAGDALGAGTRAPVAVLGLVGTDKSLTVPGAAVMLPIVTACVTAMSADAGWMYQGSRPRPPPDTGACFTLNRFGVAVRMLIVAKSTEPRALRKPELVPMESALCMESKERSLLFICCMTQDVCCRPATSTCRVDRKPKLKCNVSLCTIRSVTQCTGCQSACTLEMNASVSLEVLLFLVLDASIRGQLRLTRTRK